jgi:hypothetical protein
MVYQANTDRSGATYRFRSRSSARFAVLEVSHSVAHAESDYKVENGGNDGYIDQHEQEGHRHVTECTPPAWAVENRPSPERWHRSRSGNVLGVGGRAVRGVASRP